MQSLAIKVQFAPNITQLLKILHVFVLLEETKLPRENGQSTRRTFKKTVAGIKPTTQEVVSKHVNHYANHAIT